MILYLQRKSWFSISPLAMSSILCLCIMVMGAKTQAQSQLMLPPLDKFNPNPNPLPIVPPPQGQGAGNAPTQSSGKTGNGNTPPAPQTGAGSGAITPKVGVEQQLPVNPGFPWLPDVGGINNGAISSGSAGITIDYTCPLLDRSGTNDLMASLDALARALPMKSACNNNETNFNELYQKQKEMFKSVEEIKSFITNSNTLWAAGKSNEMYVDQIKGFNDHISNLMSNISYISDSLENNGLLDTTCNSKMISKGKALNALSDLILQISPYALYAANAAVSIGADMTLIGPVFSGFTGLSSLVNTMSKLNKSNSIDMSQAENRLLVMKATCEYMRIEGKLRYLRLAKIGTKDSQNEGLNKLKLLIKNKDTALKQLKKSLLSTKSDSRLEQILEERRHFYNDTKLIREKLKSDWNEYVKYDEFRKADNSESNLCNIGTFIVEDKGTNKFPYTITTTIESLEKLSNFEKGNIPYRMSKKGFFDSLVKLDDKVTVKVKDVPVWPNAPVGLSCGSLAQDVLNKIAKILQVIESQVLASEKSFEEELKKSQDYAEWYQQNESLIKERDSLNGIVNVITKTSEQISDISLSELNMRLELLRNTLFGTRENFSLLRNSLQRHILNNFGVHVNLKNQSPLGSWFESTANEHAKFVNHFNVAVNTMLAETKAEVQNNDVYIGAPPNSRTDYFQYFNLKIFPEDSRAHSAICNKLRDAASNWKIAEDHLNKMKNVCDTLKDYIDTKTGAGVIEFCGIDTINRDGNNDTFIKNIEKELKNSGLTLNARKVNEKYVALKCF